MIPLFAVQTLWSVVLAGVNLLPTWTVPSSLVSGGSAYTVFGTLGGYAGQMSEWIDFTQVAYVISAMLGVMVIAAGIYIVRHVIEAVPFIGNVFRGD